MNTSQAVCNYALLQFLPYPETGEFVNVGVLVTCMNPCLLHFHAELMMTDRMRAMFPRQNERAYAEAISAPQADMERARSGERDPKTCQLVFGELVRRRESTFRFGEVRTILTKDTQHLVNELFARYVRMETLKPTITSLVKA